MRVSGHEKTPDPEGPCVRPAQAAGAPSIDGVPLEEDRDRRVLRV